MKTRTNITYLACALFASACLAVAPSARAICQDGCGTGNNNTFLGADALISDTIGIENTAIGHLALTVNTTGIQNTATGSDALGSNIGGSNNTAVGFVALESNST